MADAEFAVSFAGPLVTFQDKGRPGNMRYGVSASGPMDRLAFDAAHAALGNASGQTAVEVSLGGLMLDCKQGQVTFAAASGGAFRREPVLMSDEQKPTVQQGLQDVVAASSSICRVDGENGVLKDVPIFVSFFIMYLIGVLSVVPFIVGWKFRKKPSARPEDSESDDEADSGKKKVRVLGARKRRKKSAEKEDPDIDGADVENGEEGNEAVSDAETPSGVDLS